MIIVWFYQVYIFINSLLIGINRQTVNIHAIVNYAREYRIFTAYIGISSLLCSHQLALMLAASCLGD